MRDEDAAKAIELINARGSTVVNYRGYDGEAALHIVARRRDGTWLGYLLSKGADPNVGDKNGDTALIIVSRIGYDEGATDPAGARRQGRSPPTGWAKRR